MTSSLHDDKSKNDSSREISVLDIMIKSEIDDSRSVDGQADKPSSSTNSRTSRKRPMRIVKEHATPHQVTATSSRSSCIAVMVIPPPAEPRPQLKMRKVRNKAFDLVSNESEPSYSGGTEYMTDDNYLETFDLFERQRRNEMKPSLQPPSTDALMALRAAERSARSRHITIQQLSTNANGQITGVKGEVDDCADSFGAASTSTQENVNAVKKTTSNRSRVVTVEDNKVLYKIEAGPRASLDNLPSEPTEDEIAIRNWLNRSMRRKKPEHLKNSCALCGEDTQNRYAVIHAMFHLASENLLLYGCGYETCEYTGYSKISINAHLRGCHRTFNYSKIVNYLTDEAKRKVLDKVKECFSWFRDPDNESYLNNLFKNEFTNTNTITAKAPSTDTQ